MLEKSFQELTTDKKSGPSAADGIDAPGSPFNPNRPGAPDGVNTQDQTHVLRPVT